MKTFVAFFSLIVLTAGLGRAVEKPAAQSGNRFKIVQTTPPIYPIRMLNDGISSGAARVVLHIDSTGKLIDSLVVAYTRRPFADEVLRVIKKWKFEPAYDNGEPIETVLELTFNFEVNGVLLVQRFGVDTTILELDHGYEYQACSLKKLDSIPTPVSIVSPTYPKEWVDQGIIGKVVIDFYIDETGKVRFPAAPAGSDPRLAGIAVAAVSKWQFAPPTRKGQPVLVHAQQSFDFCKEKSVANAKP
ncbi:MAG: energy transducer TonB [Nibricoccus sp.]